MKTKEFVLIVIFIIVSLIVFYLFPISDILQKEITLLVFFVILPALFNKFILKNKLNSIGIRIGDWKQGLIWSEISLLSVVFIFFILVKWFNFLQYYRITDFITNNFLNFIFYEFIWVLFSILIYDFFFRGFIMFSFARWVKWYWAILIQTAVFIGIIVFLGSSVWPFMPFLVFAPFAGLIAYKSGSIWYSSVAQLIMFIILDATVVRLVK